MSEGPGLDFSASTHAENGADEGSEPTMGDDAGDRREV